MLFSDPLTYDWLLSAHHHRGGSSRELVVYLDHQLVVLSLPVHARAANTVVRWKDARNTAKVLSPVTYFPGNVTQNFIFAQKYKYFFNYLFEIGICKTHVNWGFTNVIFGFGSTPIPKAKTEYIFGFACIV